MNPAVFFGMAQDAEDYEEPLEEMDLSGWMNRSPPSLDSIAAAHGDADPDETPIRTRKRQQKRVSEPEPMGNISGTPEFVDMGHNPYEGDLGYAIASGNENPWNPLWAHDSSLFGPKTSAWSKTGGLSLLATSGLYLMGRKMQLNKDMSALEAVMSDEDLMGISSKAVGFAAMGFGMYMIPALGWNHGALGNAFSQGWKGGAAKVLIQTAAVAAVSAAVTRGFKS